MIKQGLTTEEQIKQMELDMYNVENNVILVKKKASSKKHILSITFLSALCVLTLVFLLYVADQRAKNKLVDIFGVYLFFVESDSMVPTLPANSIFVSNQIAVDTVVAVGDIITFKNPNGDRITHRVADIILEDGVTKYKTKGDSIYNSVDPWSLLRSDIEGVFLFKFPLIGGSLNG